MKNILFVESSPRAEKSLSRRMTRRLEENLRSRYPGAEIIRRDLTRDEIPHLDEDAIEAFATGGPAADLSNRLCAEFMASDMVVIASPMWNFGVPSSLKAWIDHVVRAGRTFAYTENGLTGLAKGKKVVLVTAAGGVYSDGPMKAMDFVEPYLRGVMGFIGVEDIQSVRVEGAMVSSIGEKAVSNAENAIEGLTI